MHHDIYLRLREHVWNGRQDKVSRYCWFSNYLLQHCYSRITEFEYDVVETNSPHVPQCQIEIVLYQFCTKIVFEVVEFSSDIIIEIILYESQLIVWYWQSNHLIRQRNVIFKNITFIVKVIPCCSFCASSLRKSVTAFLFSEDKIKSCLKILQMCKYCILLKWWKPLVVDNTYTK